MRSLTGGNQYEKIGFFNTTDGRRVIHAANLSYFGTSSQRCFYMTATKFAGDAGKWLAVSVHQEGIVINGTIRENGFQ
jgi:hypothetical protein